MPLVIASTLADAEAEAVTNSVLSSARPPRQDRLSGFHDLVGNSHDGPGRPQNVKEGHVRPPHRQQQSQQPQQQSHQEQQQEEQQQQEEEQRQTGERFNLAKIWWLEMAASLLALSMFAAIFGTVYPYQGKPLPQWRYSITINTLVAIYSEIMKAAMMLVIGECELHPLIILNRKLKPWIQASDS